MPKGEIICLGCGQYESECVCPSEEGRMEAKDKLLKQCIERDESIRYLFYDKDDDTQDNIKLSILANALEISFEAGKQEGIREEQERMTKALRELHKRGWSLGEVIEAEDTSG